MGLLVTHQRQPAIVSPALRKSAAGETCTVQLPGCQGRHGVVLAHLRLPDTCGTAMKPPDTAAVFACAACHRKIDGPDPWPETACSRPAAQLLALVRTHRRMWQRGLLIIPDVDAMPEPSE